MTTYQWLLGLHVIAAFLFVSGGVTAGIFHTAALGRDRPSEVAALLRLSRAGVAVNGVGAIAVLVLGIWLVDYLPGYGFGDAWIIAALALWVASGVPAAIGGRSLRKARELAERLAAEGDVPSPELRGMVADRTALVLNYLSFAMVLAILGLMILKPA